MAGDGLVDQKDLKEKEAPLSSSLGSEKGSLLRLNQERFAWLCRSFLSRLYSTVHLIPSSIRSLFRVVVNATCAKFAEPETPNVVLSGIFFLRFLCPEFLERKQRIKKEIVDERRLNHIKMTCLYFVKFLQHLANGNSEFVGEMQFCGLLVEQDLPKMHSFFRDLVSVDTPSVQFDFSSWFRDVQVFVIFIFFVSFFFLQIT